MPQAHRPGHTQVYFSEVDGDTSAARRYASTISAWDMPYSGACFVKSYPTEDTEAFLDRHLAAFAFLGDVP